MEIFSSHVPPRGAGMPTQAITALLDSKIITKESPLFAFFAFSKQYGQRQRPAQSDKREGIMGSIANLTQKAERLWAQ